MHLILLTIAMLATIPVEGEQPEYPPVLTLCQTVNAPVEYATCRFPKGSATNVQEATVPYHHDYLTRWNALTWTNGYAYVPPNYRMCGFQPTFYTGITRDRVWDHLT
jgi:hypothetical protein